MRNPKAAIRRLKIYRAIFASVAAEMKYAGLLTKKGDANFQLFNKAWWLFFLIALLVPEPFLDPTVYFVSILALTVGWLFAALQYQGAIVTDSDAVAIRGRVEVFSDDLNVRLKKEGFEIPDTTPDLRSEFRTKVTPETVRAFGRSLFLYGVFLLSQRAILAAIVSLIGLLWGPALSRAHIGYWSPVSILYALTFPYAVLLIVMILAIVAVHYYMGRVRADASAAGQPRTDSKT